MAFSNCFTLDFIPWIALLRLLIDTALLCVLLTGEDLDFVFATAEALPGFAFFVQPAFRGGLDFALPLIDFIVFEFEWFYYIKWYYWDSCMKWFVRVSVLKRTTTRDECGGLYKPPG